VALSRRLLILAPSKTGKTTTPPGGVRGKTSGEAFLPIKVRARLLEQERKRTGPWGMRWRVYLFGRACAGVLTFCFTFRLVSNFCLVTLFSARYLFLVVRDEEVPRLDPFTFTENVFVSFYIELYHTSCSACSTYF